MISRTQQLIDSAVKNIDENSNFFSTIAGSRTLAMLASFKGGRDIIKSIILKKIPISIFSYPRTVFPFMMDENTRFCYTHDNKKDSQKTFISSNYETFHSEGNSSLPKDVRYRGSSSKAHNLSREYFKRPPIAENENVLTVLIDVLSYDVYKLLFNRILTDSKKLGPGCLSSLTDALLYLQEEGNAGKI